MIKIGDVTDSDWQMVNEKNRNMVEEFLEQSTTLSSYTLKQYRSGLRIYFKYISENLENKNFYELKGRDFLRFQNWLVKMEQSSSSIRFKRSCVSTFNNFVELFYGADVYKDFRNYVSKGIPLPASNDKKEKIPLTLDEYKMLCEKLAESGKWQVRAYLIFSFETGARRNEVRQLLKEVLNYEPKTIGNNGEEKKIYSTNKIRCKGRGVSGKQRTLQFGQNAHDAIKTWIDIRGEDNCPYVFVTKSDGEYKKVGESTFNSWGTEYIEPMIGRNFFPHLIRSSRVTTLVKEDGKSIDIAQKLLGHQSSATTSIYLVDKEKDNADNAFT
jgi:integrase